MVETRLVEVPVRSAREQARCESLLLAEHQVVVAAEAWHASWAGVENDVPPGVDRKLYDAMSALIEARRR